MDALLKEEIRRIDSLTCSRIGSYNMMENAGSKMADIIINKYNPKKVLLLLGSGGNAGDALGIGRILLNNNINVDAFCVSNIKNPDSLKNLELFKGNIIAEIDYDKYDLIIDGILGNNQEKQLDLDLIDLISNVNNSKIKIVSIDMPTGINTNNGISLGGFIKSDLTITVEYPKTGLFLNDGLDSYTELKIIKIGLDNPTDIIKISEEADFNSFLEHRNRNSNKGTYGKATIIAGSIDYSGASLISYNALNQFMMGVGYSILYVPSSLYEIYILRNPEIIVRRLDDNNGYIKYNEDILDEIIKSSDSISIGMGMGVSSDLYKTIGYLLNNYDKKLVIDADGLNTISKYGVDILKSHKCEVIITPHPKEFSRLINKTVEEVLKDSFNLVKKFAIDYNLCVILKGASSIISNNGDICISTFGNQSLAKGGSGDALSGILSGVCATSKKSIFEISKFSCYVLGKSSELAILDERDITLTISKISSYIPKVIKNLKGEGK